jgi:hypothetical protein
MSFYVLRRPASPWGDYGDILVHGMTAHRGREGGLLQLERTGPFVPPITQPGIGDVLVTDDFRRRLEQSGLTGLAFRPVHMRHIVRVEWEAWNREADEPTKYPASGEPENYILARKHNDALAEEIGPLWEVVIEGAALVTREGEYPHQVIRLKRHSLSGADLFRAEGVRYVYVSERAKDWLEREAADWVRFVEAPTD